jgi:hypothetical protein
MNEHIERIKTAIEPLRQQIINHKVYPLINDVVSLKLFMQYHVYAVWDFMSLLKSLQNNLTCTTVPWFPKGKAQTRYLINEIVAGEESDVDNNGNRVSHYELYLDAMQQCGADVGEIEKFTSALQQTGSLGDAFTIAASPKSARSFVEFTFDIIRSNKDYLQAAVFTFGREDLIPSMFLSLVNDIDKNFPGQVGIFKYYLERHIEVDGGHHSILALQMTEDLCGEDALFWQEAEEAVMQSLTKRIELWDGVYNEIVRSRQPERASL